MGSSDIGFVFVVYSVFVEPVIDGGLEVDVITEVAWSGTGDKELSLIGDGMEAIELFVSSLIIFADQTELVSEFYIKLGDLRLVIPAKATNL